MPRTPIRREEAPAAAEQDEQLAVWGPA